jgi:hypothetical protein
MNTLVALASMNSNFAVISGAAVLGLPGLPGAPASNAFAYVKGSTETL